MRALLLQTAVIALIWAGMFYFLDDLFDQGMTIFYVVTSWLLLLIVLVLKKFFQDRKK